MIQIGIEHNTQWSKNGIEYNIWWCTMIQNGIEYNIWWYTMMQNGIE